MKLAKVINNDVFEVRHGVELTPVGMNLPATLNEDQWNEIGDQVTRLENASNWILGDWWAFGEHKYGSRKKWLAEQKARRGQVKSFSHLRTCGWVCRAFETSRRRDVVSFEMHRELLRLPEDRQETFLDLIAAGEIKTHRELRAKIALIRAKKQPAKKAEDRKQLNAEEATKLWLSFLESLPENQRPTVARAAFGWTKHNHELLGDIDIKYGQTKTLKMNL